MSREDPTTLTEDEGVPLGKRTRKEWRFAVRLARYEALRPNSLVPSLFWRLRHWHLRRWVVDHEDGNDVLPNVMIRVWNGLETFREDSQLYTWLYRVATNEC